VASADKPIFLIDVAGYWQPLRALLDHVVEQRFAMSMIPRLLEIVPNSTALMTALGQTAPGRKTRSDLL
jgi:predicted Rossmann-fold nucleotide-binding protein